MKFESIDSQMIYYVRTDEKQWYRYIRFSHDDWMVFMGESLETCYDCEELEKKFQKYIITHNKAFTETKEQKV